MNEDLKLFAYRIRELRVSKNMTQKEFAKKIGVTPSALSAYETNTVNPSLIIVVKIAKEFNISLDWLCGITNEQKNQTIENYGELAERIIQITNIPDINCKIQNSFPVEKRFDEYSTYVEYLKCATLEFDNEMLIDFFDAWRKMKENLDNGYIDEELYDLWINKKISELSKEKFNNFNPDLQGIDDEYLPF